MKLVSLIEYLINSDTLIQLYSEQDLNLESEALLIYMRDKLDMDSEIRLFEIEETEDNLVFEKDEVKYIQLFPVDYAIELIESDLNLKNKGYSSSEMAKRLLEYRLKDA